MTLYDEYPVLGYRPTLKNNPLSFDLEVDCIVYDDSAVASKTTSSGTTSLDTESDFDWDKERDVKILADGRPKEQIVINDGAGYSVTITQTGKITIDADADKIYYYQLSIENIDCNSLAGIAIENKMDINILVAFWDSTPNGLLKRKLKPGERVMINSEIIKDVDSISIQFHNYEDDDLKNINNWDDTGTTNCFATWNGYVAIFFDNYSDMSLAAYAMLAGGVATAQLIHVDDILKVIGPLEQDFQRIAELIGEPVLDLMTGYATGWAAALTQGWISLSDVLDYTEHVNCLKAVASNPAGIVGGISALGAGFMSGWLRAGLSAGAVVGVAIAVLAYFESIKRYYLPIAT